MEGADTVVSCVLLHVTVGCCLLHLKANSCVAERTLVPSVTKWRVHPYAESLTGDLSEGGGRAYLPSTQALPSEISFQTKQVKRNSLPVFGKA